MLTFFKGLALQWYHSSESGYEAEANCTDWQIIYTPSSETTTSSRICTRCSFVGYKKTCASIYQSQRTFCKCLALLKAHLGVWNWTFDNWMSSRYILFVFYLRFKTCHTNKLNFLKNQCPGFWNTKKDVTII